MICAHAYKFSLSMGLRKGSHVALISHRMKLALRTRPERSLEACLELNAINNIKLF